MPSSSTSRYVGPSNQVKLPPSTARKRLPIPTGKAQSILFILPWCLKEGNKATPDENANTKRMHEGIQESGIKRYVDRQGKFEPIGNHARKTEPCIQGHGRWTTMVLRIWNDMRCEFDMLHSAHWQAVAGAIGGSAGSAPGSRAVNHRAMANARIQEGREAIM